MLGLVVSNAVAAETNKLSEYEQLAAEVRAATPAMLAHLSENDQRLQDYISGRLLDMAIADHARTQDLDKTPESRARRIVEERTALVEAAMSDFLAREKAQLPALDELARQRYAAQRQQYRIPEQIRVAHILLLADVEKHTEEEIALKKQQAEALAAELAAGADFAELAKAHSEERATAERGGELPRWAERGNFVPPFEKAVWALKPGETSGVVRTRFGYHLIKLLEHKEADYRPFEAVRAELILSLQDEIIVPRRTAFVDSFRSAELDAEARALLPQVRQQIEEQLQQHAQSGAN